MNKAEKSAYNRAYGIANRERIAAKRAARRAGLGEKVRRCSVPGCTGVYDAQGFCGKHYASFYRLGDPLAATPAPYHNKTPAERLAAQTKRGPKCWLWTGAVNRKGYGLMRAEGQTFAHRIAFILEYGSIPKGNYVLHRCDNPACVRPSHLWLGTLADNNADMAAKGRARGKVMLGCTNPKAKLTEAAVKEIRASESPLVELARKYGVSATTIGYVRRGRIWKHVQ